MTEVKICVGSSCHLKGSYLIIDELKRLIAIEKMENDIALIASFCTGDCVNGVCMEVDGEKIKGMTPDKIKDFFYLRIVPLVGKS